MTWAAWGLILDIIGVVLICGLAPQGPWRGRGRLPLHVSTYLAGSDRDSVRGLGQARRLAIPFAGFCPATRGRAHCRWVTPARHPKEGRKSWTVKWFPSCACLRFSTKSLASGRDAKTPRSWVIGGLWRGSRPDVTGNSISASETRMARIAYSTSRQGEWRAKHMGGTTSSGGSHPEGVKTKNSACVVATHYENGIVEFKNFG